MKTPQFIELSVEDAEALVERMRSSNLATEDRELLEGIIETLQSMSGALEQKNMSIKRLRKMIFGSKSEKTEKVQQEQDVSGGGLEGAAGKLTESDSLKRREGTEKKQERKPKGHGRNGADEYAAATRVSVKHSSLKPGDRCPECPKGKVYPVKPPSKVIAFRGQAPIQATVYELERLRCNACGVVFPAAVPEEAGVEKYDETAAAMIAILKYGSGFPFNRLDTLQENLQMPLPSSTQWDTVEAFSAEFHPVYGELVRQAAQGEVFHNDDTTVKILELMKESEEPEDSGKPGENRTGMFTTGIISVVGDQRIALFYSGRNHAGENLAKVLSERQQERSPPIQMADALSRNAPKGFTVLLANCLAHARRQFVEISEVFSQECLFVLKKLREVYGTDEEAKRRKMDPEQRLALHQRMSTPVMEEIRVWIEEQFEQKKIEPNSSLGQALSYLQKHWGPLTLFLREPGAPIDNNIVERSLKMAILHRKGSMFYKTLHGASVGDLFMSLIHTCHLAGVNAFDYLTTLKRHSSEMREHPELWMPWNYQLQLP